MKKLSLSFAGRNDNDAKAQGDDEEVADLDFLIDVISREVLENPEGDGFTLKLEVSPSA